MKTEIINFLMESFGMDAADAEDLYLSYLESLTENVEKFEPLMAANDFTELTRAAHTIKGCARNGGDQEMSEKASEMESAGKDHDMETCKRCAAEIREMYEKLKAEQ